MIHYIIYGSLWNFELYPESDSTQIGDFLIRKFNRVDILPIGQKLNSLGLDQKEFNFISTLLYLYQARPNRDFPHYVVETELSSKGDLEFERADRKIKYFISALKLYQKGDVLGRCVSVLPKTQYRGEIMPIDADSFPFLQNQYILKDVKGFEKFLKSLPGLIEVIDSISIDRFYTSFMRFSSPVDRLIDLIISLEGLFNKSSFDIKYKVAIRTSHLLFKKRSTERQEVYLKVVNAYNLRNRIVHGQGNVAREELEQINLELEDIVRKIIIKSLNINFRKKLDLFKKNLKDEEIDKLIVNS